MNTPKPNAAVYELIQKLCTTEQIKGLLRKHKKEHPEDITITSKAKKELVDENLLHAVEAGAVPAGDVYDLLRNSEENGAQHIFYYKPRTKKLARRYRNGKRIAESLWGKDWEAEMGFPQVELVPNDYAWADFRTRGGEGKPNDWVAKVYGHEVHLRYTGKENRRGKYLWREFEPEETRVVSLARWNEPDLLELRVPRATSRKLIKRRLERLWDELEPALSRDHFVPWELSRARLRLLAEQHKYVSLYRLGDTRLVDTASGIALLSPYTEQEDLLTPLVRREVIEVFLKRNSDCRVLAVTWLKKGPIKKELRTVVGERDHHEVVVFSKTGPKEVDHVTNSLRFFNSKGPKG